MREYPWHVRQPNLEQYQWFRNLLDFHDLTRTWLSDLDVKQDPHQIKRVLSPAAKESLEILNSVTKGADVSEFENVLDDAHPEELLTQMEHTVWVFQAWTLNRIVEKTAKGELAALTNRLEQSSWKAGKACAKRRWPKVKAGTSGELDVVLMGLRNSPFSGYPHGPSFLVRRKVATQVQLECLDCPQLHGTEEVRSIGKDLCRYHAHWIRGFVNHLSGKIAVDYQASCDPGSSQRCLHKWYFHESAKSRSPKSLNA